MWTHVGPMRAGKSQRKRNFPPRFTVLRNRTFVATQSLPTHQKPNNLISRDPTFGKQYDPQKRYGYEIFDSERVRLLFRVEITSTSISVVADVGLPHA